jgi:hypothetical protein
VPHKLELPLPLAQIWEKLWLLLTIFGIIETKSEINAME